jgi:alpha-ribazole phosphatase
MTKQLWLVRHPQPEVAAGLCYGHTDLTVAPAQLSDVATALLQTLPTSAPLYSSPLRRCADLALRLPHASLRLDARLMEIDFGNWEMQPWQTIARADIDAWAAAPIDYRPGGGESVLQMAGRVSAFLDDLLREPHDSAIVICHAGTMRLLAALQRSLPLREAALHAANTPHKIGYGETLVLDFTAPTSASSQAPDRTAPVPRQTEAL